MRRFKTLLATLLLTSVCCLTACGEGKDTAVGDVLNTEKNVFESINNADIPDTLEFTVGTVGDVSLSAGITDAVDYTSVFTVTFNDVTDADYDTLMEHYRETSTGLNDESALVFDWGTIKATLNGDSIVVNAFIK